MHFTFEDFALDTDRRELRRDATPIAVEPQVFDLIAFLIANRHRVVSRDNLIETVWKGRIVSESTLATRINAARRAVGDSGEAQRLIRTSHGKGFRFVGEVAEHATGRGSRPAQDAAAIAVLPFDNLSRDSQLDRLTACLTEDLIASLSNIAALSVSGSRSPGVLATNEADLRHVAISLGVRYLLRGSVQGSSERVRVTAQLIDGAEGTCVWSNRYDRPADDLFTLQDDVVSGVSIDVSAKLASGDHAHVCGGRSRNLNARLLYIRAVDEWLRFNRLGNFRARALFGKAQEADREWPSPLSGLAATYREAAIRGWGGSREENLERATALAEQAMELGPENPVAYTHLGCVRIETGRIEEGVALLEKAVELAPGDFCALSTLAQNLPRVGEDTRGLAVYTWARQALPVPVGPHLANEGFALYMAGQRERAIDVLSESIDCSDIADAHVRLAAAYVDAGQPDEARAEVGYVLAREPGATIAEYTGNLPFPDHRRLEWYQDLLRDAGLPGPC